MVGNVRPARRVLGGGTLTNGGQPLWEQIGRARARFSPRPEGSPARRRPGGGGAEKIENEVTCQLCGSCWENEDTVMR